VTSLIPSDVLACRIVCIGNRANTVPCKLLYISQERCYRCDVTISSDEMSSDGILYISSYVLFIYYATKPFIGSLELTIFIGKEEKLFFNLYGL